MVYVIFDLEATCDENNREYPKETIEIGAVKLDSAGLVISEFTQFIKPKLTSCLTDFCKELTTIQQVDIDTAESFDIVFSNFLNWIGPEDYTLYSWGAYDIVQLEKDCKLSKIFMPKMKHINLKRVYKESRKLKREVGMKKALCLEKIDLDGTHHRGIDDAKNIAKIFKLLYF